MTKGANTWNHKIKTAAFERLSTDATEARMLLAAVTAWLMDKGSSLDMVEVAWYMDETYFTAVSRFKKIKVMANKLIRDAHKSGRPKPTTYSTKKPPVSRKQRARTSTLGGTVTPNTVSPTASSRSSPKSFSPRTPCNSLSHPPANQQLHHAHDSCPCPQGMLGNYPKNASWTFPEVTTVHQTALALNAAMDAHSDTAQAIPYSPGQYLTSLPVHRVVASSSAPTAQMVVSQDPFVGFQVPEPYIQYASSGYHD